MQGLFRIAIQMGTKRLAGEIAYEPKPVLRLLTLIMLSPPPRQLVSRFQWDALDKVLKLRCIQDGV